jgi:hypothetical protein
MQNSVGKAARPKKSRLSGIVFFYLNKAAEYTLKTVNRTLTGEMSNVTGKKNQ